MPVCKFQSHKPSAAAEMVSDSSSSRSRTRCSMRLRSVMSCMANNQHSSPPKLVVRIDCNTVRCSPLRTVSNVS